MTLCTDDLQTTKLLNTLTQFNISTTTGHIGCNGYSSHLTCIRNDLCLQFMELRIQHLMRDSLLLKHLTQHLGGLNGNGTNQNRLSLLMCLYNICNNCIKLVFLCLVYGIIIINTCDRQIGRNFNNIHTIDITELLLLSQSRTCHTGFLLIFIKEVLERNGSQGLALSLDLHMLLRLNCLMKTI